MKRNRAFSLVDSLVAMAIVLTSVAAYGALTIKSRRYLSAYREHTTAREVFAHVRHLPGHDLDSFGTRFYDHRGLPGKPGDKYRVVVKTVDYPGIRTWWCKMTFLDWQGASREQTFYRTEWRPYEGL